MARRFSVRDAASAFTLCPCRLSRGLPFCKSMYESRGVADNIFRLPSTRDFQTLKRSPPDILCTASILHKNAQCKTLHADRKSSSRFTVLPSFRFPPRVPGPPESAATLPRAPHPCQPEFLRWWVLPRYWEQCRCARSTTCPDKKTPMPLIMVCRPPGKANGETLPSAPEVVLPMSIAP